ncbi:3151_t:CDS:2, partial [Racocetra persica]
MEEFEEFTVSNDALYDFSVTNDTSYENIQGVNDILYNKQSQFDVSAVLYMNDQTEYENNDMINCEGAQHDMINCEGAQHDMMNCEGTQHDMMNCEGVQSDMVDEWCQLINKGTQVCEHYGQPESTKSKDTEKETTSKRIGCIWQINLSCLEKNNPYKIVYVTKLIDEHKNHSLDRARYQFRENLKFTVNMAKEIYMPVLHRIIQRFRPKSHDQTNDASRLYEELLKKKEIDPQWYVEVDWDHNSKCL